MSGAPRVKTLTCKEINEIENRFDTTRNLCYLEKGGQSRGGLSFSCEDRFRA